MTPEFCTLFDINYLPRGLALYASLRKVEPRSRLRVFCMDDRTHTVLEGLDLPGLTAIPLGTSSGRIRSLRPSGRIERRWSTAGPRRHASFVTASSRSRVWTRSRTSTPTRSSSRIPGRCSASSATVRYRSCRTGTHPTTGTSHETSGIYNVSGSRFTRDRAVSRCSNWWRERCLEWCYCRFEDGKFGDQKYLDDWPERFEGVRSCEHIGGGVAPWNVANYSLRERDGRLLVDDVPRLLPLPRVAPVPSLRDAPWQRGRDRPDLQRVQRPAVGGGVSAFARKKSALSGSRT